MNPIGMKPCPCGHKACKTYQLTGIGNLYTGSGFTQAEADALIVAFNSMLRIVATGKCTASERDAMRKAVDGLASDH